MTMRFAIREDDLTGAQTLKLLELHLLGMYETSPPEAVFALDLTGLQDPAVTMWGAWAGNRLAAIGALKMLGGEDSSCSSCICSACTKPRRPKPCSRST